MDEIGWANGTLLPCSMCLASPESGTVNRTTDHALYNSNLHSKWWTLIASPLEQRFPFHLTFSYTPYISDYYYSMYICTFFVALPFTFTLSLHYSIHTYTRVYSYAN